MRAIACIAFGVLLVALTARPPPRRQARQSDLRPVLLRPAIARTMSKSQLPLLIDLYWLRVLNAIGDADSPEKNRALHAYGVVLTELDPRFYVAYTYIGLNIPFRQGRSSWANGDLAADLLSRGLKQFPQDMRLHLYLGFTYYSMEHKYKEAAAVFAAGSKTPNAPSWMAGLATRLLAHDGDAREALSLARQLVEGTSDEATRLELEARVEDLEIEVLLQDVDDAAKQFLEREGRAAQSIDELVAGGLYRGPLLDAKGGRISLKDGKGDSTSFDQRIKLYE